MASVTNRTFPETVAANPISEFPVLQHHPQSTRPPRARRFAWGRAAFVGEGINWLTLGVIVAFHLGALAALFFFTWQRLAVMPCASRFGHQCGHRMCYHRLLTHRGYQVPKWLEYMIGVLRHTLLEGGPIFLGGHTSRSPPTEATTKATRTPSRRWLVGTHRLAALGNTLHQQTEVLARYVPISKKIASTSGSASTTGSPSS